MAEDKHSDYEKVLQPGPAPDASAPIVDILHKPPAVIARGGLYLILIAITSALIWAYVSPVEIIVTARGRIVPRGEVMRIEPPFEGVVA